MEKRSNFSSFPQYFRYISNLKSPITIKFVKCGCSNYFFLNSKNLICRGTDISKCFRGSLGIRDNKSRLYNHLNGVCLLSHKCKLKGHNISKSNVSAAQVLQEKSDWSHSDDRKVARSKLSVTFFFLFFAVLRF